MKKTRVIAHQEIKNMMKEKSLILIFILEMLLISSSGLMTIGYDLIINPSQSNMAGYLSSQVFIGVVTQTRPEFVSAARDTRVRYIIYDELESAIEDMGNGVVDSVIYGNIDKDNLPIYLIAYLPENSPKQGIVKLSVKRFLADIEQKTRKDLIVRDNLDVKTISYELPQGRRTRILEVYLVFTIPLLVFMPALISGNLIMDSLIQEIESGELLNLQTSPITKWEIISGKMISAVLVTMIQIIGWILIIDRIIIDINGIPSIILFGMIWTLIYTFTGAIIALISKQARSSQSVYTLIILMSMPLMTAPVVGTPLMTFSPSYIVSHLGVGFDSLEFIPQIASKILIAAILLIFCYRIREKLEII